MTTSKQEVLIEALKNSIAHTEEVWNDKSQSPAYCYGYLQGAIRTVIQELEIDLKLREAEEQELQDEYMLGSYSEEEA